MDTLHQSAGALRNEKRDRLVKEYIKHVRSGEELTFNQRLEILTSYECAVLITTEKPKVALVNMLCLLLADKTGIDQVFIRTFIMNELRGDN